MEEGKTGLTTPMTSTGDLVKILWEYENVLGNGVSDIRELDMIC